MRNESESEWNENVPMARLEETCGIGFENIDGLGLEHDDPRPPPSKYSRRQEQGIHIRQS